MAQLRQEIQEKEDRELTLHPKTLTKTNQRLLQKKNSEYSTGDKNLDLYLKSTEHEKRNKESEEYWYEKQADECKFKPQINNSNGSAAGQGSVKQIQGTDAYIAKMRKAREEAEFKKKMTERSGFSATAGVGKARKDVKTQLTASDSKEVRSPNNAAPL